MGEVQYLIFLIVALAILVTILLIALFCKDKPCRLLRRFLGFSRFGE